MVTAAILLFEIISLPLVCAARAEAPASPLPQRLDRLVLDCYPSATEPGTAVLVMVDGEPVLRKGYGMADLEKGVKVTPDTIFRIASITKQFTAIAVLQLVQEGKVSLTDPITKYVPDFDTQGKTITIENLLTHTSGLFSMTALDDFVSQMTRDLKPIEVANLIAGKPLEFEPGSRFKYSNTNYILLGVLIEKISGRTWAENIELSIAKPLGLADTRYCRDDALTPRHARGYDQESSGQWVPMMPVSMTQPYAAGALESTVDDLAKWTQALADGKAVDPKLLERAWTPYEPTEPPSDYGYGWFIRTESGERWIGHNGGMNGFRSAAVWIPEKKVFVAILRNWYDGGAPDILLRRLALEAVGRPEPKRVAITLPAETLDRYVGVYALSPEVKFTISRNGNKLFAEAAKGSKVEIFAEAENKFFTREGQDVQFSFTMENERATQLTLRRGGRDSIAKREK